VLILIFSSRIREIRIAILVCAGKGALVVLRFMTSWNLVGAWRNKKIAQEQRREEP
jgi:hypothetical protein